MFAIDEVILRLNNNNFLEDDFRNWLKNILDVIKTSYLNYGIIIKMDDFKHKICKKMDVNFIVFVKYMYKIFDKYSKIVI